MKNILFVNGLPDHKKVTVDRAHPLSGEITYRYIGGCELYAHIEHAGWRRQRILLDLNPGSIQFKDTHCVINQIAEPDLCSQTLQRLNHILSKHPGLPIFNAPEHVLKTRRDHVYALLKDINGVRVPHTLRFNPLSPQDILEAVHEHTGYPVIVKACGEHNGRAMVRLNSAEDAYLLHRFALDGSPYYLMECIDIAQQGIYHKHRLVSVQGQSFARHSCFFDHWLVNYDDNSRSFMAQHPAYQQRERQFLRGYATNIEPGLRARFADIYRKIPLDLVGLDCALLPDGTLVIFELNANMQLFSVRPEDREHLEAPVNRIREAIVSCIQQKTIPA